MGIGARASQIVLRIFAGFLASIPISIQRSLGRGLGAILRWMRIRASVVRQNLLIAYPDDQAKRVELFGAAYQHLGQLILEILLHFGKEDTFSRYVKAHSELRGLEHWQNAKAQGKGVVFLSCHVGNWEVMAATGGLLGSIDLMLVTKHLKPEWLHQKIETSRQSCGVGGTYEPNTLRDVLRHLKKNGTVGFVLDQYAGPPVAVRVPVFGIPVGTSTAVATIIKRTEAVLLPVVNYRAPEGRWVVEIRPPVPWKSHEDPRFELAANTAQYAALLEKDVRKYPEQWLWIHRRFKGDLAPLGPREWSEGRSRR